MKSIRKSHIVLALLAVFAAAVLFVNYGTVLLSVPFASVHLNGPTSVDSDGEHTVAIDTESRRALIMNSSGDLTGVVSCSTIDSPVDAITDVCVSNNRVYVSGVRYMPDSDNIFQERVAVYDKGGNFKGVVYELEGDGSTPLIKSLSDVSDGVVVSHEKEIHQGSEESRARTFCISFVLIGQNETKEIGTDSSRNAAAFDVAVSDAGEEGAYQYAILNSLGILDNETVDYTPQVYEGHVYTSIDIDEAGTLYACDDETNSLLAISADSSSVNTLLSGKGFHRVHVTKDVVSTCNSETNTVTLCSISGTVLREFTEVTPSIGFSARMLLVWASGLYLVILFTVLAIRKLRQLAKDGKTGGVGAMFAAVAVVIAIAVAAGSLSYASYQKMLDVRGHEIKMCADYLDPTVRNLSDKMEKADNRNALRGNEEELAEAGENIVEAIWPVLTLVYSANTNDIGLYFSLYGKDDKGIFFLYGNPTEYVMGTSARNTANSGLQAAFDGKLDSKGELLHGRALRDTTQYRLVQIPTSDGNGIAGVIEIGSRMRSFEYSVVGNLAQRILELLVLMLVVYLTYSELRTCGRCLFTYRRRRQEDGERAAAVLTRPFTFFITMLTSIDSVMTVLIARELLTKAGMGESNPLLAVPAVMLGVGMIAGQGLYSFFGSRVGVRKLMFAGSLVMFICACVTFFAVASGIFWAYCAAKLLMAVPFGMLYALGYSLPRIAVDDGIRGQAAGGVKRTDTSAAALGTVLGGYAAQTFGNVWVYALVAVACLPVILMALNLLPRGMQPLEKLAQPDSKEGRISSFVKTPIALGLALFIVLPATLAAGYSSFLFPLFSSNLGLTKAQINNVAVLGQLVVFVLINSIDYMEARYGKWKVTTIAIALLGLVFLLFAVNTTLVWSIAVIALVGVLGKSSDGWKAMWLKSAGDTGVSAGRGTSSMLVTRSFALIVQPFIMGALLGLTDAVAVIVIGLICAACAGLFFLVTRRTSLVIMR